MIPKLLNIKLPKDDHLDRDAISASVLMLGFVQFVVAAICILLITPNPRNGVLFGFSLQRIVLVVLSCSLGIVLLILALQIRSGRIRSKINIQFQRKYTFWVTFSLAMSLGGLIALISPPILFGTYGGYFERLRPLLVVIGLFPIQVCLKWLFKEKRQIDKPLLRDTLFSLATLLLLFSFIAIFRIGITPDGYYWNVAGMPLSGVQFISILLIDIILLGIVSIFRRSNSAQSRIIIDLVMCLGLYVGAVLIWGNTPMIKHYFSIQPQLQYFQPYPYSDARVHDLGALSITKGWGINFGEYTDKPLYMVFLAILHLFAGFDYNLLTLLQISMLALVTPALYVFGKVFHSRFLGVLISLFTLFRLRNAIVLSSTIASVNPRLFTTELPTLFGLILLAWLTFLWFSKYKEQSWISLATGGIVGVVSLIRMNPLLFFPTIPLFALFSMWRRTRKWLIQSILFLAGFLLLVTPWGFTGVDSRGQPYLFLKMLDVINIRYNPSGNGMYLFTAPEFASVNLLPISPMELSGPPQLKDSLSHSIITVTKFPLFIINHFFHNLVGAFLALPDSFSPSDQNLFTLAKRPYWVENYRDIWAGEIDIRQFPFILMNMCLVALGLGWSWNHWKWAGMVPMYLFSVYSLSLGLARNSGSRYLVPIDWVIFFYFSIGVAVLINFLSKSLPFKPDTDRLEPFDPTLNKVRISRRYFLLTIMVLLCVTTFVPIADTLIPERSGLCYNMSLTNIVAPVVREDSSKQMNFMKGEFLYPYISKDNFSFVLLTCRKAYQIEIQKKHLKDLNVNQIIDGQVVIIGWPAKYQNPSEVEFIIPLRDQYP